VVKQVVGKITRTHHAFKHWHALTHSRCTPMNTYRYILADKFRKMRRAPGAVVFLTFVALRWLRLTPVYGFVLFFDT
jgi:hypothetical protein